MGSYNPAKPGSKECKTIAENYKVCLFDGRPDAQSVVRVWIILPHQRTPLRDGMLPSYQLFEGDYDVARRVYDGIQKANDVVNLLRPSMRNPFRDPERIKRVVDVDEKDREVV